MCREIRFSDEQLQKFYDKWESHRKEIDGHIAKFNVHINREDKRWIELIKVTEENTKLIKKQREEGKEHREATEKLIDLYNTGASGLRIASWIGRFAKWLAGLAIFVGIYHYLVEHFTSGRPPP